MERELAMLCGRNSEDVGELLTRPSFTMAKTNAEQCENVYHKKLQLTSKLKILKLTSTCRFVL